VGRRRTYGSDWSSAATLLKDIDAGIGLETPLRTPLRAAFEKTRRTFTGSMVAAIEGYLAAHFPGREVTVACDDLRFARKLEQALPGRVRTVDARPVLRRIRAVKTEAEIDVLRATARINDRACRPPPRPSRGGPRKRWCGAACSRAGAKPGRRGTFNSGRTAPSCRPRVRESQTFRPARTVVVLPICQYRLYHGGSAPTRSSASRTRSSAGCTR
jgi:hypothetical protein